MAARIQLLSIESKLDGVKLRFIINMVDRVTVLLFEEGEEMACCYPPEAHSKFSESEAIKTADKLMSGQLSVWRAMREEHYLQKSLND